MGLSPLPRQSLPLTQPHRCFDCLFDTFRVGDTFTRNIESRAVVDGGPQERQAQRHADALLETVHFDRDML